MENFDVAMSQAKSRCPDERLSAPNRTDPFWSGLWDFGSSVVWTSKRKLDESNLSVGDGVPSELMIDPQEGLELFMSPVRWSEKLALLATAGMWRTLSGEQAAALVGNPVVGQIRNKPIASAFTSGLMDVGIYPSVMGRANLRNSVPFLRPGDTSIFDREVSSNLTYPEWVAVTGGRKWGNSNIFDRHNYLTTELGLRIAEYTTAPLVMGERFAEGNDLFGEGVGRRRVGYRAADMVAVRSDGLRVAIEMSSSRKQQLKDKIFSWAEIISQTPFEESGLVVVFVEAVREADGDKGSWAANVMHRTIEEACEKFPGTFDDRTRDRIGVVSWSEWFPAEHTMSLSFVQGRAHFAPERDGQWRQRCLFDGPRTPDEQRVCGPDNESLLKVLTMGRLLAGVPYWMRHGHKAFWSAWVEQNTQPKEAARGSYGCASDIDPYPRLKGV